jgi:signal transduction histidine kinase
MSTFPLEGAEAEVTAAMAIVTEITEKKHLEQALIQSEKMAALGTLAAGIAHEFGTPLNVILGRAESLQKQAQDGKNITALTTIIEQVDRMAAMVRQLLTFARRKPPAREQLHLNPIIEKGLMLCKPQLHGVVVTTDLCPHLPSMWGDADQLLQVLLNLLINARDALPACIHIETRLIQTERRQVQRSVPNAGGHRTIRVDVRDNGTGIDPNHMDHIFNPFFTTKPAGSGTGLGLAVVQGIVRDHAGQIRVRSVVGQGTTFQILLPVG